MAKPNKKQIEAYNKLKDNTTKIVFYGGAAGGGKSWLGCEWLMQCCYYLPNTRWFIGRNNLTDTRESVLVTFRKVAKEHNFNDYNYAENKIKFGNGSEILFIDLTFYPQKDPLFERLGSKEYTGGWIEEAGEVHNLAFEVLKSRIGRHLNKEYGIIGKMLITANPKKNWLYREFYQKNKVGKLENEVAFVVALVTDNPQVTDDYINNLNSIKDKSLKKRLLHGDWEYDDNPNALCDYDDIIQIFHNNHIPKGKKYITADIARLGSDKAVIMVWEGWDVIEIVTFDKSKLTELQTTIQALQSKYQIASSKVIADEDGVGGGIVDNLHIKGFVNNSRPKKGENYQNLKTQCAYKLAEQINTNQINISAYISEKTKDLIVEELEQLQSYEMDKDNKLRILPKEKIKDNIGRSPDYLDALLMRSYFEYVNSEIVFY